MASGNMQPFQKQSGWWEENKPQDQYKGFEDNATGWGNKFLQRAYSREDPTAGGFSGFQSYFGGDQYPDINNPGTVGTLGKWNSYLQGGARNYMDQNARNYANQSAATSRFGPAGGAGAGAQAQAGVNQSLAQMFGQNVAQGMGYMKDKASYDANSAGQYLGYLSDMNKADLGAGQGLLGQVLTALQSHGNDMNQWRQGAGQANAADTNFYNQYQLQVGKEDQARQQAAMANEKQNSLDQLLRRVTMDYGNLNSGQQAQMDVPGIMAYLQAIGAMPTGKIGAYKAGQTPTTGDIMSGAGSGLSGHNQRLDQGGYAGPQPLYW